MVGYVELELYFLLFNVINYFRFPSCSHQPGLTGEILVKPRKIVLMILFSFEVDTLEIALQEQQDLVDKIFIVESSASHKGVGQSKVINIDKIDSYTTAGHQTSDVGDDQIH